jgi:hypothetical protein
MSGAKWDKGPAKLANGFDAIINRFCEKRQKYIGELQDGSGGWFAREWDANGWYSFRGKTAEDPYNLAPPPKKTVRVQRCLAIHHNGMTSTYANRQNAISVEKDIFALIEIDREVEEGEGLS